MDMDFNPLDEIEDEPALGPSEQRELLFTRALRGFVRIEKSFIQLEDYPDGEESRGSVLGRLVSAKKNRALDLLLTVHALEKIIEDEPLALTTWATLLTGDDEPPVTTRVISTALRYLESEKLLTLSGPKQQPRITLLKEDGSGTPRPKKQGASGRGFFTIPFEYWTEGTFAKLKLPAKAMLLIILKETQDPNAKRRTFTMPVAYASKWYGISERTAERGYLQLSQKGLIGQKVQKVNDPKHPAGRREIVHRAPFFPYTAEYREFLRQQAEDAMKQADKTKGVT